MPRKTRVGRTGPRRCDGFNEAAARCRGKRSVPVSASGGLLASMRPRPDAAENPGSPRRPPVRRAASMRPRPDAAENPVSARRDHGIRGASMRPRPDAAENAATMREGSGSLPRFNEAAARCRGKRKCPVRRRVTHPRFNEAAARCRGKHPIRIRQNSSSNASMRPRPDAAENEPNGPHRTINCYLLQ